MYKAHSNKIDASIKAMAKRDGSALLPTGAKLFYDPPAKWFVSGYAADKSDVKPYAMRPQLIK